MLSYFKQTHDCQLYIPFVSLPQQQCDACLTPKHSDTQNFPIAKQAVTQFLLKGNNKTCCSHTHTRLKRTHFHWLLGSAGCSLTHGLLTEVETITIMFNNLENKIILLLFRISVYFVPFLHSYVFKENKLQHFKLLPIATHYEGLSWLIAQQKCTMVNHPPLHVGWFFT